MDDVVKLLLSIAGGTDAQLRGHDIILYAATDEIDRLRSERDTLAAKVKELEAFLVAKITDFDSKATSELAAQLAAAVEALRPFAAAGTFYWDWDDSLVVLKGQVTVGDLHKAARILSSLGQRKESET